MKLAQMPREATRQGSFSWVSVFSVHTLGSRSFARINYVADHFDLDLLMTEVCQLQAAIKLDSCIIRRSILFVMAHARPAAIVPGIEARSGCSRKQGSLCSTAPRDLALRTLSPNTQGRALSARGEDRFAQGSSARHTRDFRCATRPAQPLLLQFSLPAHIHIPSQRYELRTATARRNGGTPRWILQTSMRRNN